LFCESYKGFSRANKDLIRVSTFAELVHAELLMLDDIMDNSDLRHGVPTVHVQEEKRLARRYGTAKEELRLHGISNGILGGIILAHVSMVEVAKGHFGSQRLLELISYYNQKIVETAYGQFIDLESSSKKKVSRAEVERIHLYKTAKYTLETPLCGGAILAGASSAEIKKISNFAIPLGLAFQIVDDLLGAFAETDKLGKPAESDLAEGKQTYLTLEAEKNLHGQEKQEFQKLLAKRKVNRHDLAVFRKILIETGAKKVSEDLAKDYLDEALLKLAKTSYGQKTKSRLQNMASYIVERNL
ncbi:polyprenyl synthetase family protein, partial [Patescibacteria group bacterium]|nr:polyprenyl synthetase family protein [Patescibacteria group bacterium]